MSVFALLECELCEVKCEKTFDKSPLDEIMEQQGLIFDGYMRLEILTHFTQVPHQLIPIDVINLCSKFYNIDIKLLFNPKFKHTINLSQDYFVEKDIEFAALIFEDANDNTINRQDITIDELQPYLNQNNKNFTLMREYDGVRPNHWVLWPFSKSKGWLEKRVFYL